MKRLLLILAVLAGGLCFSATASAGCPGYGGYGYGGYGYGGYGYSAYRPYQPYGYSYYRAPYSYYRPSFGLQLNIGGYPYHHHHYHH